MEDDIANCKTIYTKVCNNNETKSTAEECISVPKQVCSVMKMSNTKLTPQTDCRQESREVCGPEACPIIKGDIICGNEIRTVNMSDLQLDS